MQVKNIADAQFEKANVLVRVDFNVEFDAQGEAEEHFRFDITKKTIDHIASFPGVKIAMLTHLGRPEGKKNPDFSVSRLVSVAEQALGRKVVFVSDCVGEEVEKALETVAAGDVLLLENVRFYSEEEINDFPFAQNLAKPFSVYVNEAFSVCHREHASVVGVPKILPGYAGFHLLEEIAELDRLKTAPEHPAIAVVGGAKIETKLPLIRTFENTFDTILVGGKIANEAIDQKIIFSEKVLLPKDFDSDLRLDIGPETIARYTEIIKTAKTIVWNGPMGKFEVPPYNVGTDAILKAIVASGAFVVIGGGESLTVLEQANVMDKIGFVSSGGGAMLEYLGGSVLPGLNILKN